jgi:hypothetical protein
MGDQFISFRKGLEAPGDEHYTVTPSANNLSPKPRALRAMTSGNVTIVDKNGTSIEYAVTAGEILPFRATKITAATATIVAWL